MDDPKDVANPDKHLEDNVDRNNTPRMPWHDIAVAVQGSPARDVARHFIQRYTFTWAIVQKIKKMMLP